MKLYKKPLDEYLNDLFDKSEKRKPKGDSTSHKIIKSKFVKDKKLEE
jgi:hypothetical protein